MTRGWRLFFYSDEGTEPIHIHAQKGGAEARFWLDVEGFGVDAEYEYGLSPAMRREFWWKLGGHIWELKHDLG